MKMTDTTCARCDRKLAATNTNPDHLCGYCQSGLKGRALERWRMTGKPRLQAVPRKARRKAAQRLPLDPRKLATGPLLALLGACKVEAQRRAGEARELLSMLEG